MKRLLLYALLSALFSGSPCAGQPAWFAGETLDYEISWGFITAGNARLQVRPVEDELEFYTLAWDNGFLKAVFPVHDTVYAKVRKEGLAPSVFKKILNEGSWHTKTQILTQQGVRAHMADTVFDDYEARTVRRASDTTMPLAPGVTHNILSAFYLVRTMNLVPGKSSTFEAVSGKKKYKLKVICHKREKIETVLGEIDCLVVEPVLDGDGLFNAKGKLTIWLTDDSRRIPVLMKSKIAIGSITAELVK